MDTEAPINKQSNADLQYITVKPIAKQDAKRVILKRHYMKTFPQGAALCFGIFLNDKLMGVCIFGYSSGTAGKIKKLGLDLTKSEYIEMQRLWVDDKLGHNTESTVFSRIFKTIKAKSKIKIAVTHAGGCKNDCGIVYQASNWLYFGKDKCDDFYLTKAGEYKNIIAALRFGRVQAKGKTPDEIGHELFGEGHIVNSWRYNYAYPLDKRIRKQLAATAQPYPKDSEHFRFNQQWQ